MKLKEAIKAEVGIEFNYVAVDKDGFIYAYRDRPIRLGYQWIQINGGPFEFIGHYTGKKGWRKTLREVK